MHCSGAETAATVPEVTDPVDDLRHMRRLSVRCDTASMMEMLLAIHIAGGSLALASMVVPMVARKGATMHRRSGWVFVGGMTAVSITAFALAGSRLLFDASPEGRAAGAFLFYVSLLTAAGVSAGIRVLSAKRRTTPHRHPWDLGLPVALVLSSVAMAVWGLSTGRTLYTAFSLIGLATGANHLVSWLRVPTHPMHWWFEHMGAMLGSCIAATTAFLVVNAGRLGLETFGLIVWLTPSIVGAPAIALWTAYYRRKFSRSTSARIPQAGQGAASSLSEAKVKPGTDVRDVVLEELPIG